MKTDNNYGVNVADDGYSHDQRIAISQMQDKMIMNYLTGNAVSAPSINELEQLIRELKTDIEPINKALKYKIKAESNQNWKDDLKNKMRAEMALKGGTSK